MFHPLGEFPNICTAQTLRLHLPLARICIQKVGIVVGTTLAEMCQTTAVSQRTLLWFCGSV